MITLDHFFPVNFLYFSSIWFFLFWLQIVLDTHLQKAAAIIQITMHSMNTLLLLKKETKSPVLWAHA